MDLKDYLHLYLGAEYQYEDYFYDLKYGELDISVIILWNDDYKLILRPLSDMTNDEYRIAILAIKDIEHINRGATKSRFIAWVNGEIGIDGRFKEFIQLFLFLLSKHFDLFGLIDAGLAIDKTAIKQTENEK